MKKTIVVVTMCLMLGACGKLGFTGKLSHMVGNWVQVNLPADCVAKQISAEEGAGVAVLCADGRVFH